MRERSMRMLTLCFCMTLALSMLAYFSRPMVLVLKFNHYDEWGTNHLTQRDGLYSEDSDFALESDLGGSTELLSVSEITQSSIVHAPIYIDGDNDLEQQAQLEGWPGSGKKWDPYMIEGYYIDLAGADGSCIEIRNTKSKYFHIRDCIVQGATAPNVIFPYYNVRAGIYLYNVDGGTVTNNYVFGNLEGIYLNESADCLVAENTCGENIWDGIALVQSSADNEIIDNYCFGHEWYGVFLWSGCHKNDVISNLCEYNEHAGIGLTGWEEWLGGATKNLIQDNTCIGNGLWGISLRGICDSNTVEGNTCSGSQKNIFVWGSEKNDIVNNVCTDAYHGGIEIWLSSQTSVTENYCYDNGLSGIFLRESTKTTITENICTGNVHSGIYLYISYKNRIARNTLIGNTESAISLTEGSTQNEVSENYCENNWEGILVLHSSDNDLLDNTVMMAMNCYWIEYSDSNYIAGNTAYGFGAGFYLGSSSNNVLELNTAEECSHGFWLKESSYNTLTDNIALNSVWRGFWLWDSNHNVLGGNLASYAYFYGSRVPRGFEIGPQLPETEVDCSTGNELFNNIAENHWRGFTMIVGAPDNYLHNNIARNNNEGFFLWVTSGNILESNYVHDNNAGINVWEEANDNTLVGNTVQNNGNGITLYYAYGNLIYHNNLIDNTAQAWDTYPASNEWWHPGLLEGNYWSDYTGVDDGSGGRVAGDGIGDTDVPWYYDWYPLIDPFP